MGIERGAPRWDRVAWLAAGRGVWALEESRPPLGDAREKQRDRLVRF